MHQHLHGRGISSDYGAVYVGLHSETVTAGKGVGGSLPEIKGATFLGFSIPLFFLNSTDIGVQGGGKREKVLI